MKNFIASLVLVTLVYAELPPSNSYLPPPSNSRGGGYPHGSASLAGQNFEPQIVAARSLQSAQGHEAHGVAPQGFGRSNHGSQAASSHASARFSNAKPSGYDSNGSQYARNALDAFNAEPPNYNFGYMVNDYQEGTDFSHHEERQDERAQGSYHVVLPDGRKQTVNYEADARGFKPQVSYEDSGDLARSGYDGNANNYRNSNHGNHGNHGNFGNHDNFGARSHGY